MAFPRLVNTQQAPAIAGDFASCNTNKFTTIAGQGAFVAGPNGLNIAAFAWADPTYTFLSNTGEGLPDGFIARESWRADILTPGPGFPDASFSILAGSYITAYSSGDFWVVNNGSGTVTKGMKAYANYANGLVTFAATGTPPVGATATSATLQKIVSASTGGALPVANTATGYITPSLTTGVLPVLTVTAVGSGSVLAGGVGQTVSGTGIDPNTTIVAQLTGTAGSTGTYSVSINQTAGSSGTPVALTLSGGGLTLTGANTSGVFATGMTLSGTNIPTGTTILAYGTATAGAAGTYLVDRPAATAATASTVTAANSMFFTADSSSTGVWIINGLLEGSGVATNMYLLQGGAQNANLTGLGGAGTYLTSAAQASALTAQTISQFTGVETKYTAYPNGGSAGVGELVVISSTTQG